MARYDGIGQGYAAHREEDPGFKRAIRAALKDATSVVNVGAGAGSYEPDDMTVLAVEPSAVMAAQRPLTRPAIRGVATALPLHDQSVDAAMTVLSMHHWYPDAREGVEEMCRVARDAIAIVTFDPVITIQMWLLADYFPEVREQDAMIFPPIDEIISWLDRPASVEVLPIHRDTPDHNLMAFWAHPEWVLDPGARAATSGFARQPVEVQERVVAEVARDLESGAWDEKYGHLRELEEFDCGLRLIKASAAG